MKLVVLLFIVSVFQRASSAPKGIIINAQIVYIDTKYKTNESNEHIIADAISSSHSTYDSDEQWIISSPKPIIKVPDFVDEAFVSGVPVNESLVEKLNEADKPQKLISAPGCPL